MKRLNLRQGLLFLALIPSSLIAILLVIYFTFSSIRTLENELHSRALAATRYLAPISEYGIISGQTDNLYNLAQATMQQPGVKAAIIVNKRGRPIAISGRVSLAANEMQSSLSSPSLIADTENWLAYGAPVIRTTNEADLVLESVVHHRPDSSEVLGHVFVEMDKGELIEAQRGIVLRSLAIIGLGLMLVYLLATGIADNLARPILRLAEAVRRMSTGDLSTRVINDTPGEVGELEAGFNEMAKHLEDAHQSMQSRIEDATAQLAFQARHDALTGLINRREFENQLQRTLESIQAGGNECSFLFIDLDRFKPVNDACGHLAGDELLRQISLLLQGRLREGDTLARLGGDEFGVLLPNCTGHAARQVANDICALTTAYRFIWQDKIFAIGASIGLTTITQRVRNMTDILGAADAACYRAKESGRNQIAEQEAAVATERRKENTHWQERILKALADDSLKINALPIRALHKESTPVFRVELAASLDEPGQASLSLTALMDAAERYELASRIDRLLIGKAIAALVRTRQSGIEMHCFVPISSSSLKDVTTLNHLVETLATHGIGGEGLYLSITEDMASRHISQSIRFSHAIKIQGCQIVLDQFGGGIASFNHLRTLSPHYVKLDQSTTRESAGNRASTALLRAIVEIADDLKITTIAGNIEQTEQLQNLASLGVSCAQGYAVAPTEPFESWLEGAVIRGAG